MPQPFTWRALVLAAALAASACSRRDVRIQQHKEKLESLGATTAAIGEAWLKGSVSGTYTGTALEQTFMLIEQERTSLASAPQALLDPRGAQLSKSAERLSRLVAVLLDDVNGGDSSSARKHLSEIPIRPGVLRQDDDGPSERQ